MVLGHRLLVSILKIGWLDNLSNAMETIFKREILNDIIRAFSQPAIYNAVFKR